MDVNDELELQQNPWYGEYLDALLEQQQAEAALQLCAARRAHALARLQEDGWTQSQIASVVHLSVERVWQLVDRDRRNRAG
jgi:DNA-directed RNA polymerase specialized sigma24 family protein